MQMILDNLTFLAGCGAIIAALGFGARLAGKNAMRYVYKINNYPGATDPVYATLLVYKNEIVGGDVTDTSAKGKVQGFRMPSASTEQTAPSSPVS